MHLKNLSFFILVIFYCIPTIAVDDTWFDIKLILHEESKYLEEQWNILTKFFIDNLSLKRSVADKHQIQICKWSGISTNEKTKRCGQVNEDIFLDYDNFSKAVFDSYYEYPPSTTRILVGKTIII